MNTYGLIGFPLSHSFSKKYFTEKFVRENIEDHAYELFPIENIQEVSVLFESVPGLRGINVTIPHKVGILPFLDEMEAAAQKIGAVNCVSIRLKEGKKYLKGYNTDAFGFSASLKPLLKPQHTKALILGNGGAAKAVKYVLEELGIDYLIVVRTPESGAILYSEVSPELLETHLLIINTTPLGMSPNVDTYPELDYSNIGEQHLVYDLVYNPLETAFLSKAAANGATIKNGLEMLHKQAEKAWEIWNN